MKTITDSLLNSIQELTPLNPFLFNRNGCLNLDANTNNELKKLCKTANWNELFDYFFEHSGSKLEYDISSSHNEQKWLLLMGQVVEYNKEVLVLCYYYDISNSKKKSFELDREKKLRTLMLEVTQSIFIAESIADIFDLSLVNSIKALEKSKYGSIMIKEGNVFKPVSYYGFSDDILNFVLPCEESFLARNTNNRMDKFVSINQENLGDITNFNLDDDNKISIQSTLTGPIYVEGNLYGIISLDSFENNAFDEEDVQTMEFIRKNIEVAITNHKLFQEKLVLSRFDNLTSLYNRHYFEEQFELNRKKAQRYNEEFYIVLFDIDYFKSINDKYGHFIGDQVLKHISSLLYRNQRESDILARFGGDEFIGLIFESDYEELKNKYYKLNSYMRHQSLHIDNFSITCSFSFGIAQYPKDGKTLDDLVKVADFEMYKNKRSSR